MKRRTFIGMAALLGSPAAFSQQAARTFKLGILFAGTLASSENYFRAFFESLASLGYVEGKNLLVERRFADGHIDRLEVPEPSRRC
jgi:putative ABC transport system substrate-binding protein